MKIIYTKDEILEVMQKHFVESHSYIDDQRKITEMTLAPDRITIELGPVPESESE